MRPPSGLPTSPGLLTTQLASRSKFAPDAMSVPRSRSVPRFASASLQYTTAPAVATATAPGVTDNYARPKLPRHRSAVAISVTKHVAAVYTPRVEREDPFSLSGFFPANLLAREYSAADQGSWEWLRASSDEDSECRSSYPSPMSENDDEWNIPTPCSPDEVDAFTRDAIKREDKLGILALSSGMSSRLTVLRFCLLLGTVQCSPRRPLLRASCFVL